MLGEWRILDCSRMEGRITASRGSVVIEACDRPPVRVPMADVACVLIGYRVGLSGGALHHLTAGGAAVLLCDWRGVPEAGAYAWSEHSRIGARRAAQARLSLPRQKAAWQRIVREKVLNQARTLDLTGGDGGALVELAKKVRSGDPDNIEGRAASEYWKRLCSEDFRRRMHTEVGFNGMLDYAYTVGRGHAVRAVLAAGLEPSIGVHHRHRENMFCLADDFIEIVRPVIDYHVWSLWSDGVMSVDEGRQALVAAASAPYSADGYTVPTALEMLAQAFGQYVEGQKEKLDVPRWTAWVET
ncbi:MAG: type II CRISPR-associated endonuclease Cas1 [Actinomycetaceae bacterium]|nr:type II CRISPR-associated endonuclease Cas1 [Actinomycetaceae bacterium]MDU0970523.1 type II CRISPR-associated endonuclease Cas1 [Actinomycetaceae bacterium]